MAQYLKPEVEARILASALREFSERGYNGARMADIAKGAGISAGNIYHYYEHKDALFYAVVNKDFADEFMARLRRRVRALTPGTARLSAEGLAAQAELLEFWIDHRLETVVLLSNAEGSIYEGFTDSIIDELVAATRPEGNAADGQAETRSFVTQRLFKTTIDTIVDILANFTSEDEIRQAFLLYWRYHLAGLTALTASGA